MHPTAAEALLDELPRASHPAAVAQACLYLHDAYCVLDRADQALYKAKQDGRDRCVIEGQVEYEALVTGRYRRAPKEGR